MLRALLPDLSSDATCTALAGGLNNRCFVLEDAGARYLLRLRPSGVVPFVLSPDQEQRVAMTVARAGIGPEVIAADSASGMLVLDYLPTARPWDSATARLRANSARIAGRLRELHAVTVEVPAFAPAASVEHYATALARGAAPPQHTLRWQEEYVGLAWWYLERFEPCVLCHNDLVADNVLDDGAKLWLVDFEYACCAHPILDLASVAALNGYRPRDRAALCAAYYHGRRPPFSARDFERVVRMQELLAYFWAAWSCTEEIENSRRRAYSGTWATLLQKRER